jgi:hypothetical protein
LDIPNTHVNSLCLRAAFTTLAFVVQVSAARQAGCVCMPGALSDTSVARRPRYVQRKEPRELQSYAVIASSTSSSIFMVRASAKAPMSGLSSWYRMSRLQKARTAKAGSSIRATRPAITLAQSVKIAPQAWRASVLREPVELVAEATQKRPDREYSGVRLSAISLTLRATRIRSRRAIRRVSQKKTT